MKQITSKQKYLCKVIGKHLILFTIGGLIYIMIELLYRGDTHWSMAIVGGVAFICCGLMNEIFHWETPLWKQALASGGIITLLEFFSGILINLILKWDVWDYTNYRWNLLGQICLPFSILWCLLAVVAIIFDDYLRYWIFSEEKPRYRIF